MAEFGAKGLSAGHLGPKSTGKMPAAKPAMKMGEAKAESKNEGGEKAGLEVHDHGDGTAHTMMGGQREEHPDHMHAVAAVAHHLMPEGGHFHAHHDGFTSKSHGIHESGEHAETQEHQNPEEMHGAMDAMMGEGGGGETAAAEPEPAGAMGGFQG